MLGRSSMNGSPADEKVPLDCLEAAVLVELAFERVRKGFRWLSVLLAAPVALCKGVRPGRDGRGAAI